MLAARTSRGETAGRQPATAGRGGGRGVKTWPWVSLNIEPGHLDEFTALAARLGRSRADLLREVLEQVGLPYARAIAANRGASEGVRKG